MIVTADDFGLDEATNTAISQAFDDGLISRTSIMPNMPGFAHACEIAHERRLLDRVGIHLVLTQGVPLTETIRHCDCFCDEEGRFFNWRQNSRKMLSKALREALALECRAQIHRCLDSRLLLSHADSHHHVHVEPAIAPTVISVVRASRIRHLRLARNCGPGRSAVNRAYQTLFNISIRRLGLAACRFFGRVDDYLYLCERGIPRDTARDMEVETHPRLAKVACGIVDRDAPDQPFSAHIAPLTPI